MGDGRPFLKVGVCTISTTTTNSFHLQSGLWDYQPEDTLNTWVVYVVFKEQSSKNKNEFHSFLLLLKNRKGTQNSRLILTLKPEFEN
jgi:hypothetical protein